MKLTHRQRAAIVMIHRGAGRPRQVTLEALRSRGLVTGRVNLKVTEEARKIVGL